MLLILNSTHSHTTPSLPQRSVPSPHLPGRGDWQSQAGAGCWGKGGLSMGRGCHLLDKTDPGANEMRRHENGRWDPLVPSGSPAQTDAVSISFLLFPALHLLGLPGSRTFTSVHSSHTLQPCGGADWETEALRASGWGRYRA